MLIATVECIVMVGSIHYETNYVFAVIIVWLFCYLAKMCSASLEKSEIYDFII